MTINDLVTIVAPSGYEDPIFDFCEAYAKKRGFVTWRDKVGNLIISSGEPREKSVAFYAHADQIGFVIKYIDDGGFLRFKPIGGWDTAVLLGQNVVIVNGKNEHIRGVINRAATHLQTDEEQNGEIKAEDLWIDIGAEDREKAESLVSVGDVGTIQPRPLTELHGNLIAGQALDDRIGISLIFAVLENTRKLENVQVFGVINKAEEIGNFDAAAVAAAHIGTDYAIAIDVTPATDQPGISMEKHGQIFLGAGPSIGVGGLVDRKIAAALKSCAVDTNTPYQIDVITSSSGTDMDGVFRTGTPSGVIYIPCRYLHTPTEVVSLIDIGNAVILLTEYCTRL